MNKLEFKIACARRGVTGAVVALAIGVSPSAIWAWSNGYYTPRPEHKKAVAEFLSVPESLIFSTTPNPKETST